MSRLDDYRNALLAADPDTSGGQLTKVLDAGGDKFPEFIIAHGLGPIWHERTGRAEFHESRLAAEALYLAQKQVLSEVDAALDAAGVEYAVIKGAANRQMLYDNPAARACGDIDLLVSPADRVRTAATLIDQVFVATPEARSISRELVLTKGAVDIDLHWGLLREGRLRSDCTDDMLSRRRRSNELWMLSADDAFFVLLVHPAFAKHLAGWGMGLHRVADIIAWLRTQPCAWQTVRTRLVQDGVRTAAWATLRWVQMLGPPQMAPELEDMLSDLKPGRLRCAWLDHWLSNDLSQRTSGAHWARLVGFSLFLHDTPGDAARALAGRSWAHRRSSSDLAAFEELARQ